jgi:hypothetical protein
MSEVLDTFWKIVRDLKKNAPCNDPLNNPLNPLYSCMHPLNNPLHPLKSPLHPLNSYNATSEQKKEALKELIDKYL